MSRPERALILLKPQFLGDAVMACPLIGSIASEYEFPIVTCGPIVRELLACLDYRVRFKQGEKISGIVSIFRTAKVLRGMRIQHAYIVNRSFRSALAVKLAGIPKRVGHLTEGRGFLLTHKVSYDPQMFEAECYLDLARAMNVQTISAKPKLAAIEPVDPNGATVGIQPGARYPDKQVPLKVMAEVGAELMKRGERLALFGGEEERESSDEFERLLPNSVINFVGKLKIHKTMGCLENLKLMIGSDTGLMHIAAALGTPTVTVFGPNPASKWGHRYEPHRVIEAPGRVMQTVTADQIWTELEGLF